MGDEMTDKDFLYKVVTPLAYTITLVITLLVMIQVFAVKDTSELSEELCKRNDGYFINTGSEHLCFVEQNPKRRVVI